MYYLNRDLQLNEEIALYSVFINIFLTMEIYIKKVPNFGSIINVLYYTFFARYYMRK